MRPMQEDLLKDWEMKVTELIMDTCPGKGSGWYMYTGVIHGLDLEGKYWKPGRIQIFGMPGY